MKIMKCLHVIYVLLLVVSTVEYVLPWGEDYPPYTPPYIVWDDQVFDDIIPFDENFYEPCQASNCHSPIIDTGDPQESEDENYEEMDKNITRPSLEAFKRTWTDPYAERPTGREHSYELEYLDMVNQISLEKPRIGGCHGARCRFRRSVTTMKGTPLHTTVTATTVTPTVRKEYRTMTPAERDRFHKAIQALKASGAYDTIAKRHKISDAPGAHNGPCFTLWHRQYILQFEVALQLIDPLVFLPYWDSSMDGRLGRRYKETSMFDSHSLGQWNKGAVTDGAFANFTAYKGCTGRGKIITRQVGRNTFYTSGDFNRYNRYRTFQQFAGHSGFEDDHGYIHVAVGGHLSNLNCSPVDPIFFLHHAFVDYLWWRFRKTQKGKPTSDFVKWAGPNHKLNDTMKPFEGMKNKDGLKLMPSITYEESPSMSRCKIHANCNSDMLWCDRGRCTAKVRVGTWCRRKNPASCFCEHGTPSCAGKKKRKRRRSMKCVCTDPANPTNDGNTATPAKVMKKPKTGIGRRTGRQGTGRQRTTRQRTGRKRTGRRRTG